MSCPWWRRRFRAGRDWERGGPVPGGAGCWQHGCGRWVVRGGGHSGLLPGRGRTRPPGGSGRLESRWQRSVSSPALPRGRQCCRSGGECQWELVRTPVLLLLALLLGPLFFGCSPQGRRCCRRGFGWRQSKCSYLLVHGLSSSPSWQDSYLVALMAVFVLVLAP